jgi:Phytanoyl-CoA dioxygenase (PhyH)
MRLFKRKDSPSGAAVAERPPSGEQFQGSTEELFAEIRKLTDAARDSTDPAIERQLMRLRHLAGIRLLDAGDTNPSHPEPAFSALPETDGLPEFRRDDLTPALVRAGILRDGCVLVRGLIDREEAVRFATEIDRAYDVRARRGEGNGSSEGYYEEMTLDPRFGELEVRDWIEQGGGLLAADSPRLTRDLMGLLDSAGVSRLIEGYLGEAPLVSVQKTTLRKALPSVPGKWHQDGAFMGDVRSINLWLALSRCGDVAPGLDIVPRRLNELVTGEMPDDPNLYYLVNQEAAEKAAGDRPIIRPIFEPGDALIFDEMFLHQTASDPSMPNPRFAVESWFFGASAFPPEYAPIAV